MKRLTLLCTLLLVSRAPAQEWKPEDGFVSLFNGKDLTGWCFKDDDKTENFDGKTQSTDGRFMVKGDAIVTGPPPAGAPMTLAELVRIKGCDTDFTLKLEFRVAPQAQGAAVIRYKLIFLHDFPTGPNASLKGYKPGDWNVLTIAVKGLTVTTECNGELLQAASTVLSTGDIGVAAQRGQMEYRHIQIKQAN